MTVLDPSVTAKIIGEGPELRQLRSDLSERMTALKVELEALEAFMAEEHARFAGRYTPEVRTAAEYVAAAWRNLNYAQQCVAGR